MLRSRFGSGVEYNGERSGKKNGERERERKRNDLHTQTTEERRSGVRDGDDGGGRPRGWGRPRSESGGDEGRRKDMERWEGIGKGMG